MDNIARETLKREYAKRFSSAIYWQTYLSGYARFSIKNQRIIKKSWGSILYGVFIIICVISAGSSMLYEMGVIKKALMVVEVVIVMQIAILVISYVIHITVTDRSIDIELIEKCVDLDVLLGVNETKFMRDIADKVFLVLGVPVFVNQCIIVTCMYITYDVPMWLHVTGSLFFWWCFYAFYDINFMLFHSAFISLRTRYLNVALMKTIKMRMDDIPDMFLFTGLYWKTQHDDLVELHNTAEPGTYVKAFKMLFLQLQDFQRCFRFDVFTAVAVMTVGALFSVQASIAYGGHRYGDTVNSVTVPTKII